MRHRCPWHRGEQGLGGLPRPTPRDQHNLKCGFVLTGPGGSLGFVVGLEELREGFARVTPIGAEVHPDGRASPQDVPCRYGSARVHEPVPCGVAMPIMDGQDGAKDVEPVAVGQVRE